MTAVSGINFDYNTNGLNYGVEGGLMTSNDYQLYSGNLFNTESLERMNDYTQTQQGYQMANAAIDQKINAGIENISSYIVNGQEDYAYQAYEELIAEMTATSKYGTMMGEDGDDKNIRAYLRTQFEAKLGCSLEEFIRNNTRNNEGVEKQQLLWGKNNCDEVSQEDLLNSMCNLKEDQSHANVIEKAFLGVVGLVTKAGNAVFGHGKKH